VVLESVCGIGEKVERRITRTQIKGTFYQSELQNVDVREDDEFKVEKVL
jgi:hypothetical protein